MPIEIVLGYLLDLILGDPRWFPHPVKLMGKAITALERLLRYLIRWERLAGIILVLIVVGGTYLITALILGAAYEFSPALGIIVGAVLIWTTLAVRDLAAHARRVFIPLSAGNVARARENVAMMVGRDVEHMDEPEIVRACVEAVAENTVDGVLSPLFYAFIGGAPLAMAFKAVSTLDSMIGYKNEKYLRFGWAGARLDDLANWIPARICGLLMPIAALFCTESVRDCWRIMWRDGSKHESPNSGIPEAAMAGALRVQLGGVNYYDGERCERPYLGDPIRPLVSDRIQDAVRMMYVTSLIALFLGLVISWLYAMLSQRA